MTLDSEGQLTGDGDGSGGRGAPSIIFCPAARSRRISDKRAAMSDADGRPPPVGPSGATAGRVAAAANDGGGAGALEPEKGVAATIGLKLDILIPPPAEASW